METKKILLIKLKAKIIYQFINVIKISVVFRQNYTKFFFYFKRGKIKSDHLV